MLVDANLLLYASDATSTRHAAASSWLIAVMQGDRRLALPWQTIGAFVRIATSPRIFPQPLSGVEAWSYVEGWLAQPNTWIPPATERTAVVYGTLARSVPLSGNLVPDAMLAALAMEHGLVLMTTDTDFARFPGLRWENPIGP